MSLTPTTDNIFTKLVVAMESKCFDQVNVDGEEYKIYRSNKDLESRFTVHPMAMEEPKWIILYSCIFGIDKQHEDRKLLERIADKIGQRGSFIYLRNQIPRVAELEKQAKSTPETVKEELQLVINEYKENAADLDARITKAKFSKDFLHILQSGHLQMKSMIQRLQAFKF